MLCVWFCFRLLTARSELSQSGRCRGDEECAEVLAREGSSWFPLRRCEGLKIDPLYIVLNIQQFSCGSKWWSARACVCRTRLINIFVENNFTLEYHTKRATALWRKRMKKVEFHCENLFGFLLNLMTLNHSIYSHKTFSVFSVLSLCPQIANPLDVLPTGQSFVWSRGLAWWAWVRFRPGHWQLRTFESLVSEYLIYEHIRIFILFKFDSKRYTKDLVRATLISWNTVQGSLFPSSSMMEF